MSCVPHPIRLSEACDKPVLYMLLGVHLYRPFAKRLEGQYSVYGVYAGRELVMLESQDKSITVPDLASDYVQIIRTHRRPQVAPGFLQPIQPKTFCHTARL